MNVITHEFLTHSRLTHHRPAVTGAGIGGRIAGRFGVWIDRVKDRQAFATLDQRDLRDLGISRWEVDLELAKPFWRD